MKAFFARFLRLMIFTIAISSCVKDEGDPPILPPSGVDHPRILLLKGEEQQIRD